MNFLDLSDPRDRTLHGVLRRQAEAIPDATYLWVDDEQHLVRRSRGARERLGGGAARARRRARRFGGVPAQERARVRVRDVRLPPARRDLDPRERRLPRRVAARDARGRRRARADRRRRARAARGGARPGAAVRARDRARLGEQGARFRGRSSRPPSREARRQGRRARGSGHGPRRHRVRALDLGHHGPLEGRDAEPQRVDPRGALGRARTRASARATRSTAACRCTTRRPGWRTSTARSSRASRSASIRRSRCRRSGTASDTTVRRRSSRSARCTSTSGRRPSAPTTRTTRCATRAACRCPIQLIDPFKKRFGIESLDQGYGQSEVLGMLHRYDVHAAQARTRSASRCRASR